MMTVSTVLLTVLLFFSSQSLHSESFRVIVDNTVTVSTGNLQGVTVSMGIDGTVLINTGEETRFFRGLEVEISAPQAWLRYQNSIVMSVYNNISPKNASGTVDITGNRAVFEVLPARLQTIYQIPMRRSHGLRTTTSISVPSNIIAANTFPVLFMFTPLAKGTTLELERMMFNVTFRPILSDEGAVNIIPRYPPLLRGRPFTVLIDDVLIDNISEQIILREGEHHLVILSEDYRNESRRFIIERAKVLDLIVNLQDPAPLIIFEAPANALVFLNNVPVQINQEPIMVEPGQHEAKIQIGDYTIIRTITVQRGKTYRVTLEVDLTINETE